MICLLLIVLFFMSTSNAQVGVGPFRNQDSTLLVDEIASGISGSLNQRDMGNMTRNITCGNAWNTGQSYTINSQILNTTLIFAFAIRDATIKPTVTLTELYHAVLNGTALASISTPISTSNSVRRGAGTNTTQCRYQIGDLDSYGNIIGNGNRIYLDWASIFTTPVTNQNAIFTSWAICPSFFLRL
jgi:hypothetical protein